MREIKLNKKGRKSATDGEEESNTYYHGIYTSSKSIKIQIDARTHSIKHLHFFSCIRIT